jgi:hypothetical protein
MSDFKTRLQTEANELSERQQKLLTFIQSENFEKVDDVQKALLLTQCSAMGTYLTCLEQRLLRL